MSQLTPGHNLERPRGGRGRRAALLAGGLLWAATMAQVLRSEVLSRRESPDVRSVVAAARLTREHASASYVLRAGAAVVGTLNSTVSGSRDEEQLAYVVEGELHAPLQARLKGVVVAGWDRKPVRLALDLDLGGVRHRVDGGLAGDGAFRLRYLPQGTPPDQAVTWEIDPAPVLAAGPLPIPEMSADALSRAQAGEVANPASGAPMSWTLAAPVEETLFVGGRSRRVRRHDLVVSGMAATAWTEETGFPVKIELPGGLTLELVDEGR